MRVRHSVCANGGFRTLNPIAPLMPELLQRFEDAGVIYGRIPATLSRSRGSQRGSRMAREETKVATSKVAPEFEHRCIQAD